VKALAARPDTLVFAGARNPAGATELRALADERQNVHVLQLTSADEADNRAAVAEIERVVGALHVVIANAGKELGLLWLLVVEVLYQASATTWPPCLMSRRRRCSSTSKRATLSPRIPRR
jgi:NAD(P)-dependent dehydrogenase (short-subunit alcohol dehydrogenase family)